MNVMKWLLDSDPAIRWQVMRDLPKKTSRQLRPNARVLRPKGGVHGCSTVSHPEVSGARARIEGG